MDSSFVIYDFEKNVDIVDWQIVNDGVMGGLSNGIIELNEDGHGAFYGQISLDNYGGFSSVRYAFEKIDSKAFTKVVLKVKGDGKPYQFRLKSSLNYYHSYVSKFETSGEWEEIEIQLEDMYPSFRGRQLDIPNFSGETIEEITFLFGNKKAERFKLLIDRVELR